MRIILIISMLAVVAGCASVKPQHFVGPNGNNAYHMKCSGYGKRLGDCYEMAGQVCPNGYSVIGMENSVVGLPMANGSMMVAPQQSMAIECK